LSRAVFWEEFMSQVFSWSVRGALVATGIIGALTVAACGGDDGTTPAA
jgi:hypothetical protein